MVQHIIPTGKNAEESLRETISTGTTGNTNPSESPNWRQSLDPLTDGNTHDVTVGLREGEFETNKPASKTILVKEADHVVSTIVDGPTTPAKDMNIETKNTTKTSAEPPSDKTKRNKKLWTPFQKKTDTKDVTRDTSDTKTSQFNKFCSYISNKLKFVPEAKSQQQQQQNTNQKPPSLQGAIGFATTGAALLLIDECKDDIVATVTSTTTLPRVNSSNSLVNQFDLIDCGIKHESTSDGDVDVRLPSPDGHPMDMPYDSIDDVVEEMFKTMKTNSVNGVTAHK